MTAALVDVSEDVRLYSARQLAEVWGCGLTHIYELIRRGELETIDLGLGRSKMRVPASSALAFIERKRLQAASDDADCDDL